MGEIIESTRRHYVGDDADKASIPAGGKAFGDSYHANDKGKQYYWNGAAWKTGLGYELVPRLVNVTDFQIGAFTVDGAWHVNGLDLSAIVPAGAVAVVLDLFVRGTGSDLLAQLRHSAGSSQNRAYIKTQVANVYPPYAPATIAIDTDRLLDYYVEANITVFSIAVVGWYI